MKIIFKRMIVHNFRSIRYLDIPLDHGSIRQIIGINVDEGGSNGSGKSNIMYAFCWGLYGETYPKLLADAVLNDILKKDCSVEIEFIRDNKHYKVIRHRNHHKYHNKLMIFEDGVDISFHKTNQAFLNSLLGLNFKLFHFCNIFQLERDSLFRMQEAKRKVFFEEFIKDIRFFRVHCFEKTKEFLSDKTEKKAKLESDKMLINQSIDIYKESIESKKGELKEFEGKLDSKYNELKKREKELINKLELIKTKISKLDNLSSEDKVKELKERIEYLRNRIHNKLILKNKIISDIERYSDNVNFLYKELKDVKEEINRYKSGRCPICFTNLKKYKSKKLLKHIDKLKERSKEITNKVKAVIEDSTKLSNKLDTITKEISSEEDELKKLEKNLDIIAVESINIKSKLDEYKYSKVRTESELEVLKDKKELLDTQKDTANKLKHTIKEKIKELRDLKNKKIRIDKELKILDKYIEHYKLLKGIFRVNIPNELIIQFSDMFEYHINKTLELMDYHNFNVIMKPEKSEDGEISKIPIYIMRQDGVLKLFNELSGGEKQRLVLAEILSIKQIVEELMDVSYNIIWMDEILDISLDSIGSTKIKDMLREVVSKKGYSIELISHSQDMLFENKLIVKKENKFSEIVKDFS